LSPALFNHKPADPNIPEALRKKALLFKILVEIIYSNHGKLAGRTYRQGEDPEGYAHPPQYH
jgi:hypothetical protein